MNELITAGALTSLLLEAVKYLVKLKFPSFEFSPKFYGVTLATISAAMPFFMVYVLGMGVEDPILTFGSVAEVLQYLSRILLNSVLAIGSYEVAIRPFKTMRQDREHEEIGTTD